MEKYSLSLHAFNQFIASVGSSATESGGMFLGPEKGNNITEFVFDSQAITTGLTYTLNSDYLNTVLKEKRKEGLELKGIGHSHPNGYGRLSQPDIEYFTKLFNFFDDARSFFVPICYSSFDGKWDFFPFTIKRNGEVSICSLTITNKQESQILLSRDNRHVANGNVAKPHYHPNYKDTRRFRFLKGLILFLIVSILFILIALLCVYVFTQKIMLFIY